MNPASIAAEEALVSSIYHNA